MRKPVIVVVGLALASGLLAGCGGGDAAETAAAPAEPAAPESPATDGGQGDGAVIFESAGCAACHTLAAAGATGQAGPNLDELAPSFERVVAQVTNGGGGMPPFGGSLSETEIEAVATFVVESTSAPASGGGATTGDDGTSTTDDDDSGGGGAY